MIFECDISREDAIYKDIEAFQDYETTYSLAYEMVVRNKKVISILEEMESLTTEGKEEYSSMPNTDRVSFTMHINFPDVDSGRLIKLKERYSKLGTELEKNFYFRLNEMHLLRNREIILSERTLTDGPKLTNDQLIDKMAEYVSMSKSIVLHPVYNTRQPSVPKEESKIMSLDIDFSLPKDEMMAQILAVKNMYNALNPLVPLPLDEDPKDEKIYDIRASMTNQKKIPDIKYPIKTKQQVYADMFFIFDILCCNDIEDSKVINFIQDEIREYYADIVMVMNLDEFKDEQNWKIFSKIKDSIVKTDKTTIQRHYEILQPFIEDLKYKKLIT